jgi:hypothetical protein
MDECSVCYKDFKYSDETKKTCTDCQDLICNKCIDKKYYQNGDWIWLQVSCSMCGKYVCRDCVIVCYECAQMSDYASEDTYVYCDKCSPDDIEYVECEYHEWSSCNKHGDVSGCGICRTNKNYHDKNTIV